MKEVGAFEAKTHFSSLLDQVERGEQITITKHGRPVARLIPVGNTSQAHPKEIVARIKKFGLQNSLAGIDWKELRDQGRS
jgi:prevent-host-death family protein